jgi:serine/threonine protein kinase
MDHPNIAKVLDAGATEQGRPYFVMELVRGIPITQFCDERRLTTRERLELAIPVCQAVQHAHQKGIIHRDLKPSNVLVALYDDKPVPKVIDFGVAKAAGPRLTDQTLYTEFGAVVGTLEYMSPEQARLNQLDVDTRSDRWCWSQNTWIGSPPTSSMTKKGRPESVVPASSTRAMFGWSIRARACRSAPKRAMTWRESIPALISLTATSRLTGSVCWAIQTVPMPPSPIGSMSL